MKPNILFIVLDSFPVRKCYGNNKTSITPNMDFLINKGSFFTLAISSADGTAISLGSMLTAVYPFKTGMNGEYYQKLDLKTISYIKLLKEFDYCVFAVVPKIANLFGLTNDFENNIVIYSALSRLHLGLGNQIIEILESGKLEEPWFYYVHLLDSHLPISVPDEFDNKKFGNTQYDKTISSVDVWIGKILKKVDLNKTIVIITADHGDYIPHVDYNGKIINFEKVPFNILLDNIAKRWPKFLNPIRSKLVNIEQNFRKKRKLAKLNRLNLTPFQKRTLLYTRADTDPYLFDDLIRIPLIFSGIGIPSGIVINQQVRSVDVFPTIADLIGLVSKKNVHGRSLIPFLKGEKLEELPAYIESAALVKKSSNDVVGIRTSNYKYFRSINDSSKKVTLYDLKNDPNEENNITNSEPELTKKMEEILTQIMSDSCLDDKEKLTEQQTKEIEEELRKLGYLS